MPRLLRAQSRHIRTLRSSLPTFNVLPRLIPNIYPRRNLGCACRWKNNPSLWMLLTLARARSPFYPRSYQHHLSASLDVHLFMHTHANVLRSPAVLAYACGMTDCWPNVNYATSSELAEHMRAAHPSLADILSDSDLRPYRCSLAGCNKSWKTLNGVQYHLQVSKVHFQQALASAPPAPSAESLADGSVQKKGKKTHPCTFPGCPNVYKQLAGLRYHLKHVRRCYRT